VVAFLAVLRGPTTWPSIYEGPHPLQEGLGLGDSFGFVNITISVTASLMYYAPDNWQRLRLSSEVRPLFLDALSPWKYDLSTLAEQVSVRRVHRYTQSSIPSVLSVFHRPGENAASPDELRPPLCGQSRS
jgi:hypothetical protein